MRCSCHSGKEYEECCKPYHEGTPAPTALALMRSRYAAYALRKVDYIIETTAASKREGLDKRLIGRFSDRTRFEGLEIIDHSPGEEESTVTFKAILKEGKKDLSFTEKSHFFKEKGRWYYTGPL